MSTLTHTKSYSAETGTKPLQILFPDPRNHKFADWLEFDGYHYPAKDIISLGDALSVSNLKEAYLKGVFPWHIDGLPLPWFCPEMRAILQFSSLHIPASLKKLRKNNKMTFTLDRDFHSVIRQCADSERPTQDGTWITEEFVAAYLELHREGLAHSVEVWDEGGNLVGGLYGVDAGGVFCGESMFFRRPSASKLALMFLIDHLVSRGSQWMDIQVMTPHMEKLGAIEIHRDEFLSKLSDTQRQSLILFD